MNSHLFSKGYEIINLDESKYHLDVFLNEFKSIIISQLDFIKVNYIDNEGINQLLVKLFDNDLQRYLSTLRLASKLMCVSELVNCKEILNFSKKNGIHLPVMQTRPVLHLIGDDLMIPGGYNGVGAHQDWPTLQSSLNTMVVWIPLVDVNEQNYTLDIIPKSHLKGLLTGSLNSNFTEIEQSNYSESEFIPLKIKKGQAFIMSSFLIHRSNMNGKGYRISISSRIEDAMESTFIERNFPYTEHKVVKRDLLFENFPNINQVLKVYSNE